MRRTFAIDVPSCAERGAVSGCWRYSTHRTTREKSSTASACPLALPPLPLPAEMTKNSILSAAEPRSSRVPKCEPIAVRPKKHGSCFPGFPGHNARYATQKRAQATRGDTMRRPFEKSYSFALFFADHKLRHLSSIGGNAMRKRYRLFLLLSLVPAFLLGSVFAVVQAQNAPAVKQSRWSDPATWPDRKAPVAGGKVTIEKGKDVVLDVSPPPLGSLTIEGKLSFADNKDLELTTEWIMVHGEFEIWTEKAPHTRKATITFTDNVKDEDMSGMGGTNDRSDRGMMLMGGTLNLHGNRTNSWTKLSKTAEAGSNSIEVLNATGWRAGDMIVLASTDFDPHQAERRTIAAIRGNTITLDKKLDYMHFGKITFNVDERGEVGMLSRNIVVQASADADTTLFGGHIMAMNNAKMYVEGVELNRMGQNMHLARYPIHWHLIGDAKGQYIKNSAVHDTYSRCVTVHGTNYLDVENNVTYNNIGHCFFLEDGVEHDNQFVHNLGILTKCHPDKPCDPTNLAPFGSTPDGQNFKRTGQIGRAHV